MTCKKCNADNQLLDWDARVEDIYTGYLTVVCKCPDCDTEYRYDVDVDMLDEVK